MMAETIYVLQNESLLDKSLPVFVGAFAAFLFSVVTLLIANRINSRNTKRQLISNLSRELKYDLSVINDLKNQLIS